MATILRVGLRHANNKLKYERQFTAVLGNGNGCPTTCQDWIFKTLYSFLNGETSCKFFIVFIFLVPIVMIAVGIYYKDDCPAEDFIPVYLVVAGSFMLTQTFAEGCARITESENILFFSIISGLIDFAIFLWLLAGSYWVYSIFLPNFKDTGSSEYCHRGLYMFAVGMLFLSHFIYTLLFICGIWVALSNLK